MKTILIMLGMIRRGTFPCLFQLITGLYCPGCGGTRAAKFLLHGQIWKSFYFHPLVLYMAVCFLVEFGSFGIAKILKRPELYLAHEDLLVKIGILITLVNWVVKNYFLIARGIDLLT